MTLIIEPWRGYLCIYPSVPGDICEAKATYRCTECEGRYCPVHGAEGEACPFCLKQARKEATA